MRIGDWEVFGIIDGWGREPGRELCVREGFEGDPWAPHLDLLQEGGWLALSLGSYLVRGPGRVVLVDLGAGRIANDRYQSGGLPERLRRLGVEPEQVTDVVFTHLHFDHIGWASRQGKVQFPNATHHVHRVDWAYFVDDPGARPAGVRKLRPVEPLVSFVEDGAEAVPGMRLHLTPGHSPGHCVVELAGGGQRVWLIGDLAHVTFELEERGWHYPFDHDGVQAQQSRAAFVERVIDTGDLLCAAHFPDLRPGRLTREGDRVRWQYVEDPDPWAAEA
ncbi:MAG: MBL fold metallo-hydrolase [Candidatus Dormibacteraceae bacterium]